MSALTERLTAFAALYSDTGLRDDDAVSAAMSEAADTIDALAEALRAAEIALDGAGNIAGAPIALKLARAALAKAGL